MWTYSGKTEKVKNLPRCLHWREPSTLVLCYSFIWTECHTLLPDSVISPRARMKMCFWLSVTFFFSWEEYGSFLSGSSCQDVTGCSTSRWSAKAIITLMDARVTPKIRLVSSRRRSQFQPRLQQWDKRPLCAAGYNSKCCLLSYWPYVGRLLWTILSQRWSVFNCPGFIFIPPSEKSDGTDLTNESEAKWPFD